MLKSKIRDTKSIGHKKHKTLQANRIIEKSSMILKSLILISFYPLLRIGYSFFKSKNLTTKRDLVSLPLLRLGKEEGK